MVGVVNEVVKPLGPTCKGAEKKVAVELLPVGAKLLLVAFGGLALEMYGRNWKGCVAGSRCCNWRLHSAGPPFVPPLLLRDLPSGLGNSLAVGCQLAADRHVELMA
ncbi:hypothetical protein L798_05881 [Zootermopsis nevadensis]|uniref:Uncharacterized protein n=1 Tax=Zootermopsis nevadensis TaxID=136037 RepID=A0A067RIB0_ZOONE|nr:hypothetical protein L798_05881 [Zootermopsis nevadensis]